jgi:hypothetical protein
MQAPSQRLKVECSCKMELLAGDRSMTGAFLCASGSLIFFQLQVKPTEASYTLRDPQEVLRFLTKLVEWGRTEENGWHQKECCIGWALDTVPVMSETQNGGHVEAAQAKGDGVLWPSSLWKLHARAAMCNHSPSALGYSRQQTVQGCPGQ